MTASAREIASAASRGRAARAARRSRAQLGKSKLAAALTGSALGLGCTTASAPPVLSPMEPLPTIGNYVPDDADGLAHSLAVGVLRTDRRKVDDCIEELGFIDAARRERDEAPTGMLPYGLQKRVELGRALALEPELLILDEPLAGLNLEEVEDMARFILDVNEEKRWKVTCLLVEHDMGVVMDLSDRVFVLNFGYMIMDGTPEEVQQNSEVVKAYLGEEDLYATRK